MKDRAFPFHSYEPASKQAALAGSHGDPWALLHADGRRYLEDILETMGEYIDSLKFAGGSFTLMPRERLHDIIGLAHRYEVLVSTGGFIEYVLAHNSEAIPAYIQVAAIADLTSSRFRAVLSLCRQMTGFASSNAFRNPA